MTATDVDTAVGGPETGRAASSSSGFRRSRVVAEVSVLLAVPAVLLGAFLLPEATKRAAAFSYTEPTLLTAFTAHYVHITVPHLLGNVFGFVLLAGAAYGLSAVSGRRRLFWTAAFTLLLVFPFVLSGLNLAVPRDAIGYGFSGINMAFFGYLAVLFAVAVDERPADIQTARLPAVFFVSVGYIAAIALPMSILSAGFLAVSVALTLLCRSRTNRRSIAEAYRTAADLLATPWHGEFLAVAAVVLVGYPFVGFPPPAGTSVRVNVYIHFLGYALAFLVVYVFLLAEHRVSSITRN